MSKKDLGSGGSALLPKQSQPTLREQFDDFLRGTLTGFFRANPEQSTEASIEIAINRANQFLGAMASEHDQKMKDKLLAALPEKVDDHEAISINKGSRHDLAARNHDWGWNACCEKVIKAINRIYGSKDNGQ